MFSIQKKAPADCLRHGWVSKKLLVCKGVTFPDGASASLNGTTNVLRVVNTPANQDIIEQIIDSVAQTEPVSVAVRVTMLRVEENRLEELGFDWMLSDFGISGDDLHSCRWDDR